MPGVLGGAKSTDVVPYPASHTRSLDLFGHAASIGVAGAAQARASVTAATEWARAAGGARAAVPSSGSERRVARLLQDQTEVWHAGHDEEVRQGQTSRRHGGSRRQAARTSHHRQHSERPARPGLRSTWGIEEEESFWKVQPRYSTHTCIGPKPEDRWQA